MQRHTQIGIAVAAIALAFVGMAQYVSTHTATLPAQNSFVGSASNPVVGQIPNPGKMNEDDGDTLPILANAMPPFSGIASWLNSQPLTPEGLRGKVTLIDFWTYSCINCLRTLPYTTSWDQKYRDKGFVLVGVHTPEFAFEKVESNVRNAITQQHIAYPVALDNDYGTWNAYNNRYWPAEYLFDAEGRLRYVHFGEGNYDVTEGNIQKLLAEAGVTVDMAKTSVSSTMNLDAVRSPETYIGYARSAGFASPERVLKDGEQTYTAPKTLAENELALEGKWSVGEEEAETRGSAAISYRFTASNVNLVMGRDNEAGATEAEVTMDGKAVPVDFRGKDITAHDGKTFVRITNHRLYSLIDAQGIYGTHTIRIQFPDAGVGAYAFTFG